MTLIMYGIPNCDTIKKARKWLDEHDIDYLFHDYKKQSISREKLTRWCDKLGYQAILNQRGTTWRKLPGTLKQELDQQKVINILLENTSAIKRPILESGDKLIAGFSPENYQSLL